MRIPGIRRISTESVTTPMSAICAITASSEASPTTNGLQPQLSNNPSVTERIPEDTVCRIMGFPASMGKDSFFSEKNGFSAESIRYNFCSNKMVDSSPISDSALEATIKGTLPLWRF